MKKLFWIVVVAMASLAAQEREVAITIDDLPRGGDDGSATAAETLKMTAKLLKPFEAERIPVTGFVNECRRPEQLRAILTLWKKAGAELGNHTCSHPELNTTDPATYEADIAKGEAITTEIRGSRPVWFRHPYLQTGPTPEVKKRINAFLAERGYRIAPVTLDNSDWMFAAVYARALRQKEHNQVSRVRLAYLSYMESIFEFFERRSIEVTGHEIRQVLLIHASQLNADTMPDLLAMMKRRRYRVVTLDRVLEDSAYRLEDGYAGKGGFSWIHRWSRTMGLQGKAEPDEPAWIADTFKALKQ